MLDVCSRPRTNRRKFALPRVCAHLAKMDPTLTRNPQQKECPNNMQPLVPGQPENGDPQRDHHCKHYQLPGLLIVQTQPAGGIEYAVFLRKTITSDDHEKANLRIHLRTRLVWRCYIGFGTISNLVFLPGRLDGRRCNHRRIYWR